MLVSKKLVIANLLGLRKVFRYQEFFKSFIFNIEIREMGLQVLTVLTGVHYIIVHYNEFFLK